ncbi:MAG: hypothetical protein V3V78_02410 [Candidatus Woesearchaeota archaeon]
MELTEEQQAIIDKAIELLKSYDKEKVDFNLHYFKHEEETLVGYDCCSSEDCVEQALKKIKEETGYDQIETDGMYNGEDHEIIERCCICSTPMNDDLMCIGEEFRHHKEYSITKEELTHSSVAFDVRVMLESMPSVDHEISGYAKHQSTIGNNAPLNQETKRINDFVIEVVTYAETITQLL